MSWTSDTAACGAVSTSHTVTGTSDYDYIAYSGVDWTFDLTTLANRDVVSYELQVTLNVEIWYNEHDFGMLDYTFVVKEYDCRP